MHGGEHESISVMAKKKKKNRPQPMGKRKYNTVYFRMTVLVNIPCHCHINHINTCSAEAHMNAEHPIVGQNYN